MNPWERQVAKRKRPPRPSEPATETVPLPAPSRPVKCWLNTARCPIDGAHTRTDGVELLGCSACARAEAEAVRAEAWEHATRLLPRPEHAETIRRACSVKVAYAGPGEALAALGELRRKGRRDGFDMRHYRCPFAGYSGCPSSVHWHVGHPLSVESMARIAAAIRDLGPAPLPDPVEARWGLNP